VAELPVDLVMDPLILAHHAVHHEIRPKFGDNGGDWTRDRGAGCR